MRGLGKAILLAFAVAVGAGACTSAAPMDVPELIVPVHVAEDSAVVVRGAVRNVDVHEATVKVHMSEVYTDERVDGYAVEWVACVEGMEVKAGDPLLRLNTDELDREIEALAARIRAHDANASDAAAIAAAEIKMAELQVKLAKEEGLAPDEIRRLELLLERHQLVAGQERAARARVRQKLDADLDDKRLTKAQAVLYAPVDGLVTGVCAISFDRVSSREVAVILADMTDVYIELLGGVRVSYMPGQSYEAVIDGEPYAVTIKPFDHEREMAYVLTGGSAPAQFTFDDTAVAAVEAGEFAQVYVTQSASEDTLVIPFNAIHTAEGERYVYRLAEDGSKVPVFIKTGIMNGSQAEVLSGLREGDVVYVKQ